MFKVMVLLKRKPGLSLEQFIERYEAEHVPLVVGRASGMISYTRHYLHPTSNVAYGAEGAEPEYDLVIEFLYKDRAAFADQQESLRERQDSIAEMIAHEETIVNADKTRTVLVEEHVSMIAEDLESDLARMVRRLRDKDEIVDLVHRYSYLLDHKRGPEIAELFTEDAVADYAPGIGPPVRGKAALRELFPSPDRPGYVATSHHNANVLVTFDTDDRATVLTSLYGWHKSTDNDAPLVYGYYHDVAVRTAEGWRLAERQFRALGQEGWDIEWHSSLPSSLAD